MTKKAKTTTPKLPIGARMMPINGLSRQGQPTFKLIPIHKDCPYMEAIFDPTRNIMELTHEKMFDRTAFLPEVDEFGQIVWPKNEDGTPAPGMQPKQTRTVLPAFYDYDLLARQDILTFIIHFTGFNLDNAIHLLDSFWKQPEKEDKKPEEIGETSPAGPEQSPLSVVSDSDDQKTPNDEN